ncbi:MAG: hypothetical protein LUE61_03040 [Clostridiales bacterium]|nr:hypothetical protein [Clostridiales bacterium]
MQRGVGAFFRYEHFAEMPQKVEKTADEKLRQNYDHHLKTEHFSGENEMEEDGRI